MAPVLIAAPNTPPERLARIAAEGEGYTYCVARAGVTGADAEVRFAGDVIAALIEKEAPPPVLGFGISNPEHVRLALRAGAAGVISGSAIVGRLARGEDVASLRRGDEGGDASLILPVAKRRGGGPCEAWWKGIWNRSAQLPLHQASPGPPPQAMLGEDLPTPGDQSVDEEDDQRSDDGGDEAGALVAAVPAELVA